MLTWHASENPLVVGGSTVVIVALFQPLCWRIQIVIDYRFYRHKNDAARTLAVLILKLEELATW